MHKGIFITFEGNDGSGKTTISKKVYDALLEKGYPVIYTREPGGSEIAEKIRTILVQRGHQVSTKMHVARHYCMQQVVASIWRKKFCLPWQKGKSCYATDLSTALWLIRE